MIPRLDSSYFDWLTWRSGSLCKVLNIRHRTQIIIENRNVLRKHAVGWCPAEQLPCRPKVNYTAVMFLVEGNQFWTHLLNDEFNKIFNDRINNE